MLNKRGIYNRYFRPLLKFAISLIEKLKATKRLAIIFAALAIIIGVKGALAHIFVNDMPRAWTYVPYDAGPPRLENKEFSGGTGFSFRVPEDGLYRFEFVTQLAPEGASDSCCYKITNTYYTLDGKTVLDEIYFSDIFTSYSKFGTGQPPLSKYPDRNDVKEFYAYLTSDRSHTLSLSASGIASKDARRLIIGLGGAGSGSYSDVHQDTFSAIGITVDKDRDGAPVFSSNSWRETFPVDKRIKEDCDDNNPAVGVPAPNEICQPKIAAVVFEVTARYKKEHFLDPDGTDYEKQGLDLLKAKCKEQDCLDAVGIITEQDEIESFARLVVDSNVIVSNYEVVFEIIGAKQPLQVAINLSKCKKNSDLYVCSQIFNNKADVLVRGQPVWARAILRAAASPTSVLAEKNSGKLVVSAYKDIFLRMHYLNKAEDSVFEKMGNFNSTFSSLSGQLKKLNEISNYNQTLRHSLKPVMSDMLCRMFSVKATLQESYDEEEDCENDDKAAFYCAKRLDQCAEQLGWRIDSAKGDRIVGVGAPDWGNGYVNIIQDYIVIMGDARDDLYVLAHEIGHTFGLGEEYVFRLRRTPNPYPACCLDNPTTDCKAKGGVCYSIVAPDTCGDTKTEPAPSNYAYLPRISGRQDAFCPLCVVGTSSPLMPQQCFIRYADFEKLGNHCWPKDAPFMKLIESKRDTIKGACAGQPLTLKGDITNDRSSQYRSVMGTSEWRVLGGKVLYPPSAPCPLRNCIP